MAIIVLVVLGLWQLPQATSARHRPTPYPTEYRPAPECPTLIPDELPNGRSTHGSVETTTALRADHGRDRGVEPTATVEDDRLQDWRYARGKWVRLSEELGIPPQPANFVQRVSPLLWAALLWLAATWIMVGSG